MSSRLLQYVAITCAACLSIFLILTQGPTQPAQGSDGNGAPLFRHVNHINTLSCDDTIYSHNTANRWQCRTV